MVDFEIRQILSNWNPENFGLVLLYLLEVFWTILIVSLSKLPRRLRTKAKTTWSWVSKGDWTTKEMNANGPFVKGLNLSVDLRFRRVNEQPSLYQDIPDSVAEDCPIFFSTVEVQQPVFKPKVRLSFAQP